MQLEVGKILEGKVAGITNFGAFIDLEEGVTGLVHISEVALEYVKDIHEHLKVGDVVKVKILSTDKGKIGLSIKQAMREENPQQRGQGRPGGRQGGFRKKPVSEPYDNRSNPVDIDWFQEDDSALSFEDKLNKFKQASDEKMHALKKNVESKRGSSRRSGGGY
ncbi:MAG: S1 RNA-binding domain-containing protein [Ruminococcaceae bacterium]|nr:S1 RNA-binding domain-containing protein [Oscillospiraceae bacterium]